MCSQFYVYLKFKQIVRHNKVVLLMDKLYEVSIYFVGVLYLLMFFTDIIEILININEYYYNKPPFVVSAVPLMGVTFKILVKEGLYASTV